MLASRVAPRDVTVLIAGESGTGKERVAEAIVRASHRADRPFIRFNCATLTAELAEAELFGHTKGAFTGAQRNRNGLFREAHGGTMLLDEIGELDLGLQAKLLRVLQEGEVRPVGEDRSFSIAVRIIAATHRTLLELVQAGQFREDLYYRLKVVSLTVPPLRERPEDVAVLARHFIQRTAERFGTRRAVTKTRISAAILPATTPADPGQGLHLGRSRALRVGTRKCHEAELGARCAVLIQHDDLLPNRPREIDCEVLYVAGRVQCNRVIEILNVDRRHFAYDSEHLAGVV